MFENNLNEAAAVFRIVHGAAEERFRESLNSRERRLELVRDIGDEIAADSFQAAQLGDVMQHEDGSGRFPGPNGSDGGREVTLAQGAGGDFRLDAGRAFQHSPHGFAHLRLPDNFDERAARLRRYVEFEDGSKPAIGEHDALRGVHDDDAFHHAVQNRGRKVALLGKGTNGGVEAGSGLI